MKNHKVVIIGATSAIAANCAKIWVNDPEVELTLVGRDIDKLNQLAADLKIRGLTDKIDSIAADFLDPRSIKETVRGITSQKKVDLVLIAQGTLAPQSLYQEDLQLLANSISINAISPILFAEEFANSFKKIGTGSIAIIGSVAGDRARKTNYIYGAGKNMLDFFCSGLRHRFAGSKVKIMLIKPGPTATPMTKRLNMDPQKLEQVEDVAKSIVNAIEKGKNLSYVPGKWKIIMLVIRNIPDFIFKRLSF
tara:strand:- start:836 stop:1585 length:750 start_codon:yes stop_codon:yes gene_type:complete